MAAESFRFSCSKTTDKSVVQRVLDFVATRSKRDESAEDVGVSGRIASSRVVSRTVRPQA